MIGLKNSFEIAYNGTENECRFELYADTASDLQGLTHIDGIKIQMGSECTDIATGDKYILNGSGVWILQPSDRAFSNVYTKAEIDSMIANYYTKTESDDLFDWIQFTITTDTLPLSFISDGSPLTAWSISGNGQQTGTPTPDNPVMPEFVGARTGNLFDVSLLANNMQLDNTTGLPVSYPGRIASPNPVDVSQYSTVTISYVTATTIKAMYTIFSNNVLVERAIAVSSGAAIDVSNADKMYVCFYSTWGGNIDTSSVSDIMLNSGSTALPYEPYGWKVPFENHGENLLYLYKSGYSIYQDGVEIVNDVAMICKAVVTSGTYYTLNFSGLSIGDTVRIHAYNGDTWVEQIAQIYIGQVPFTFITPENTDNIRVSIRNTVQNLILTPGSTPKPYSPYLNATIPVYLGEVPTVRRVKKLVLDGTEEWALVGVDYIHGLYIDDAPIENYEAQMCSHFIHASSWSELQNTNNSFGISSLNRIVIHDESIRTVEGFKSYLASQYASGHPVTIWYALATEQTGIVNEPLAKIGDYADELISEDAGVTIPTAKGSNTLSVDTTVQPSEVSITGGIRRE